MSELLHNEFPPESLEGKDLAHLLHPTTNLKLHRQQGPSIHEKAEGVYLWDSKGNQYLEGMAGLWCTALGYGNEELAKVADCLLYTSPSPRDRVLSRMPSSA